MIAYRIYADETLMLDTQDGINDGILSAHFKLEINKPSSFEFSMTATHPMNNQITMMSTAIIIEMLYIDAEGVVKDDYYPFMGRVTSISEDMYSNKTFTCEGGSAFDKDSIVLNGFESYASQPNNLTVYDAYHMCMNGYRSLTI